MIFSCILVVLVGSAYFFVVTRNKIPDEINIVKGSDKQLSLSIPVSGEIMSAREYSEKETVIPVSLDRPVTVQSSTTGNYLLRCRLFGMIPIKNVDLCVVEECLVTPVGIPIGIYVESNGILVLETGSVKGADGMNYEPSTGILQQGDYIEAVNGKEIQNKKELLEAVGSCQGEEMIVKLRRSENELEVKICPVLNTDGEYKIGVWVRDNVQGIGTLTYIDENMEFGALGHGINDMDTAELMEFGSGTLYHTDIVSIVRGENGLPGELMGIINYLPENEIGVITQNTDHGVFGKGSEALIEAVSIGSYPVAMKQDIVIGPAQILCNISGQAELYDVEIIKIEMNSTDENYNHGIVVEVTDERLLSLTGGIVQGMSGSPIMQNGKLIGAVTHVFVNNPSRGYGIFIETMLAEQNEEKPD